MSTDTCPRAPSDAAAPAAVPAAPAARSLALDRLRGLALVAMLVHHLTEWLTGDARAALPGWPSFAFTDVAAIAFFCTAGASMALFSAARRRRGATRPGVAAEIARRYGLLVPIGVVLHWLLWREPLSFGVLEALGVTVVLAAAVTAAVPGRLLPAATTAVLAAGVWSERLADASHGWLAEEVLGGTFPLVTYLGFVLVGVAAARTGRLEDRRWVAAAAVVATGAVLVMAVEGTVPDRYPGDVPFVVPGLAGTVIVYFLVQFRWPAALAGVDSVVRRAGTRALGIFVAHYLLFGLLRRAGVTHALDAATAIPLALAITATLCVLAPHVPRLPWSPRTGPRRAAHAGPAAPAPGLVVAPRPPAEPSIASAQQTSSL
jgi:peptidoglycan/LPS O-acetylase OafA/YrhL